MQTIHEIPLVRKNGCIVWVNQRNVELIKKVASKDGATFKSVGLALGLKEATVKSAASSHACELLAPLVKPSIYTSKVMGFLRSGYSIAETAKELGCCRHTIYNHLRSIGEYGRYANTEASASARREIVKALVGRGLTVKQISSWLGVNRWKVDGDKRSLGLTKRRKSLV